MQRLIVVSLLVVLWCSATTAEAEKVVQEIAWGALQEAGKPLADEVEKAGAPQQGGALTIDNQDGAPRTVNVFVLDHPKITTLCHAIVGEVTYEGMAPGSCLEMWTTYDCGEMAFSRTLASEGPLESLAGKSDWRDFVLPLFSTKELGVPRQIELNVVFTRGGSVRLGPLRLVEYSGGESPLPGVMPPADQPVVRPEQIGEVSWAERAESGKLLAGKLHRGEPPEPVEQLTIEHAEEGPKTVTVAVIDEPGIEASRYRVAGWVKHEDVAPGSYLELWSTFADGSRFFTRTLSASGPMRNLGGSRDWRALTLPFQSNEKTGPPKRLEVNVVFAGPGTVHLSPLRIEEYEAAPQVAAVSSSAAPSGGDSSTADMPSNSGAWWDNRTGIWIGALGGTGLGLLGALMGTLGGVGVGRRFVLTIAVLAATGGAIALIAGFAALGLGQPYLVYYPLLLLGGVAAVVNGSLVPVIRRRYAEIELRRMSAMDLGDARRASSKPS